MTAGKKGKPAVGVIGVPGGWSSERLTQAVRQRTGTGYLIDLRHAALDLTDGQVRHQALRLNDLDALIVKKLGPTYVRDVLDRLEMLRFLHERGVPVFSKPQAIMGLLDRMSCTVTLQLAGIPIPETIITEDVDQAVDAVQRFERAVLKPLFTSKARGMQVVEADGSERAGIESFLAAGHTILYVQRLIRLPGSDWGIVFLGGDYVGSYARVAGEQSWNTVIRNGGKYEALEPPKSTVALAHQAQSLFDLDFTCVDIAEGPDGPVVFEVSAFGGFRGLFEAKGIDAADLYADYVLRKLEYGQ